MLKYTILFLIIISYTNVAGYNAYFDSYNLGSDKWAYCYYDYPQNDYFVIGGSLQGNTQINVKFTPRTHALNAYYVTSKIALDQYNVNTYFSGFYSMASGVSVDVTKSITYTTKSEYPFMYFGFGPYYSSASGTIRFDFKTYFVSTLAAYIIVLIIIGVFIFLAAASMGIAKAMGRSPWEGLACFCILCTICCCRR